MKNLRRIFVTLSLFLGLVFQGFCRDNFGSVGLSFLGNIGASDVFLFLVLGIFVFLIVKIFSSKEKKSSEQNSVPSVSDWLGRFLTTIIPVVGLIALIVWAVDDKDKIRKNWAIAFIIFTIVLMVFSYFLGGLILAFLMERMGRS